MELPQFELLCQMLPITLYVLISLLPKFLKTNQNEYHDWQDLAQKFKFGQIQLVHMSFERLFFLIGP